MQKLVAPTLLLAALLACGRTVSLDDRACPCASGWVCCAERNVCVAEADVASCDELGGSGGGTIGTANASTSPPVTQLATAQSARCLTIDANRVYWQNADGLVASVPKGGGAVAASHFQTPQAVNAKCAITIDGGALFTTSWSLGKVLRLSVDSDGTIGASSALFGSLVHPSSIALAVERSATTP
jgi:hypothetical protein